MLHARVLPKFNPVRAGFPLVPQGMGPNELMFNGFGQDIQKESFFKTTTGIALLAVGALIAGVMLQRQGVLGESDYDMAGCDCGR